ncbi:uncharacterized protein LOC114746601 [Neltuma alba]|uniref:uncharacterized protein LOC114746601 n=1 Tax=Neltuma alba TaxID=207710 RepID=UPI0010A50BC9|nr:uncharacterized protein LOC114746601 [Prosopis alba]
MASSSFSSSIFVDSTSKVIITEQDFKNFHGIDRKLFLRLVANIGQEPRQASMFMALFLWLEKTTKDFKLVSKLLQWPDALLTDLTNEAALIFTCIHSTDQYCFIKNDVNFKYHDLPLTQKITNSGINLHFVHQNGVGIKQAIMELMNNVCDRAFDDIVVQYCLLQKRAEKEHTSYMMKQRGGYNVNDGFEVAVVPPQAQPLQVVTEGLGDASGERKEMVVAADDRTIFLTFSKGYPISESEIREFFSRRYGDMIEAVLMQEAESVGGQPLYARLVLRPEFMHVMEAIIEGTTRKSKFCINGKHLWARKYVPRNTKSPSAMSPATLDPSVS